MFARSRPRELPHALRLIAVNAAHPQHGSLIPREAPDDVVRGSQRDVSVVCIGRYFQQNARIAIGFTQIPQALELALLDQEEIVGLHSFNQGKSKERIRVPWLIL